MTMNMLLVQVREEEIRRTTRRDAERPRPPRGAWRRYRPASRG